MWPDFCAASEGLIKQLRGYRPMRHSNTTHQRQMCACHLPVARLRILSPDVYGLFDLSQTARIIETGASATRPIVKSSESIRELFDSDTTAYQWMDIQRISAGRALYTTNTARGVFTRFIWPGRCTGTCEASGSGHGSPERMHLSATSALSGTE